MKLRETNSINMKGIDININMVMDCFIKEKTRQLNF